MDQSVFVLNKASLYKPMLDLTFINWSNKTTKSLTGPKGIYQSWFIQSMPVGHCLCLSATTETYTTTAHNQGKP